MYLFVSLCIEALQASVRGTKLDFLIFLKSNSIIFKQVNSAPGLLKDSKKKKNEINLQNPFTHE